MRAWVGGWLGGGGGRWSEVVRGCLQYLQHSNCDVLLMLMLLLTQVM